MKILSCILALALLGLASAPSSLAADTKTAVRKDPVHDLAMELSKKGFNTFLDAIAKTDLAEKLTAGTFTVLAPTDNAFRDIPKAQLDALLADKEKLTALLSNHIIEGKLSAAELKSAKAKSLSGTAIEAKTVEGKLKIGTATIVKPDVPATNGVIHGIDKLLLK